MDSFNFLMWATVSLRRYGLFIIVSDKSQLILECLKLFLPLKHLFLLQNEPVKISRGPKFDYSLQLHRHTFKGLGIRDHIETSSYIRDILTSE